MLIVKNFNISKKNFYPIKRSGFFFVRHGKRKTTRKHFDLRNKGQSKTGI